MICLYIFFFLMDCTSIILASIWYVIERAANLSTRGVSQEKYVFSIKFKPFSVEYFAFLIANTIQA